MYREVRVHSLSFDNVTILYVLKKQWIHINMFWFNYSICFSHIENEHIKSEVDNLNIIFLSNKANIYVNILSSSKM